MPGILRWGVARVGLACCALAATLWGSEAIAADTLVYNFTARIDGSQDFLIIRRDTVQWHHAGTVAAPGRINGNNFATTISASMNGTTTMNALAWVPMWSQAVPNEIRFEDFSSTYTGLVPALPAALPTSVNVATVLGRGTVTLEQSPTAANDFTLIAKFADGFSGAADLQGRITVVVVPEPGILVVGLAISAGSLIRRPRRDVKRQCSP